MPRFFCRRFLFAALLCAPGVWCTTFLHGTEPAQPAKLTIRSQTALKKISPLENTVYAHPQGLELVGNTRWSPDNGKTWQAISPHKQFDSGLTKGFRRHLYPPYLDTRTDRMLTMALALDVANLDPKIKEPPVGSNEYYLRYRVSLDGGKTFLFDEPVVQKGDEYNPRHPIAGVFLGKNGYYLGDLGCQPITIKTGQILVPVQVPKIDDQGKLTLPGGGFTYQDTRVLIGTWTADNHLEWNVSELVEGDPKINSRGVFEPTLIEMPDSRLLMVMRGSNGGKIDKEGKWPAHKWFSVSTDGGVHWTKPEPWGYSNGEKFHSPSSMSQLLKHSSGRVFWVGNLTPTNPKANLPRWPLVIGEVDPVTLQLIKPSVLTIDTVREGEKTINLSHFFVREDRATHDLICPLRRWNLGYKKYTPELTIIGVE